MYHGALLTVCLSLSLSVGVAWVFKLDGVANEGLLLARSTKTDPWSTVDADSFDLSLAQAACSSLGFPPNYTVASYFTAAGGSGSILYANCNDGVPLLEQCSFLDASEFATHNNDVGVSCVVECPFGSYLDRGKAPPACADCQATTFSTVDLLSCTAKCPAGTYGSARACFPCMQGTQNPSPGAMSADACKYCPDSAYPNLQSTGCVSASWETLLNGTVSNEGLLLVRPNSSAAWGTVTSFYFDSTAASAACHSVGFVVDAVINASFSVPPGEVGYGPIYMVSCASNAFSLDECVLEDYSEFGLHDFDVVVACTVVCPAGSILVNKSTCVMCPEPLGADLNQLQCVASCQAGGFADGATRQCVKCPGGTVNPHAGSISENDCVPCPNSSIPNADQSACLTSLWDFRLVGSTRSEGRLEVQPSNASGLGLWGPIEYWSFSSQAATAACHSLGFPPHTIASYYSGGNVIASGESYYVDCFNQPAASLYYLQSCSIFSNSIREASASGSFPAPSSGSSAGGKYEFTTYVQCIADCPRGQYYAANNTCVSCPDGTYSSPDRLTCDRSCPAGSYSNNVTLTCTKCPSGTYNPMNNSISNASCMPCPAGTYGPLRGLTSCPLCPYGTYSPFDGVTNYYDCFYCPSGTFSNDLRTACDTPNWEFRLNGTLNQGRIELRPNSTSEWGTVCGYNFDSLAATAACHSLGFPPDVAATAYLVSGGAGPIYIQDVFCTMDTYYLQNCSYTVLDSTCDHTTDAAVHCVTSCQDGFFYLDGNCTLCPNGTYSDIGRLSCVTSCISGSYANSSAGACQKCPVGSFNPMNGSISSADCQPCPAGTFNAYRGMPACTPCPAGTYNPNSGAVYSWECLECPGGTTPSSDGSSCISIDWNVRLVVEGTGQVAKTRGLLEIRPNSSSDWGTVYLSTFNSYSALAVCQALGFPPNVLTWTYTARGGSGDVYSVQCGDPSYALTQCYIWNIGAFYHGNDVGLGCIVSCPGGTHYSQLNGTCDPCPIEAPFTSPDSADCLAQCLPGTFTNTTGRVCVQCPSGTYNPNNASLSEADCIFCPGGAYPSDDQASCVPSTMSFLVNDSSSSFLLLVRNSDNDPYGTVTPYSFTQDMAVAACHSLGIETNVLATFFSVPIDLSLVGTPTYYFDCSSLSSSPYLLQQCSSKNYPSNPGQTVVGLQCTADCSKTQKAGDFFNESTGKCATCNAPLKLADVDRLSCVASCRAGSYASTSALACIPCPAGTFNAKSGSTSPAACVQCVPGTYGSFPRATACSSCPVNQYLPQRGATSPYSCQDCRYGQYANQNGNGCVDPTWEYRLSDANTTSWLLARPTRWAAWGQVVGWPFSRNNVIAACHEIGFRGDVQVLLDRVYTYPVTADSYYIGCDDAEQEDLSSCSVSYFGSGWQYFFLSMSCANATQCSDLNGQSSEYCANSTLNCAYCAASGSCIPNTPTSLATCPSFTDQCSSWNGNVLNCTSYTYRPGAGAASGLNHQQWLWTNESCSQGDASCGTCQFCVELQLCVASENISRICPTTQADRDWCSNFNGDLVTCNSIAADNYLPCDGSLYPEGCGPCSFCASSQECVATSKISASTCCGYIDTCSVWNFDTELCNDAFLKGGVWESCARQSQPTWPPATLCSCYFNASDSSCRTTSTSDPCNSYSKDAYGCNVLARYAALSCAYCGQTGVCSSNETIASICPLWTTPCSMWSGSGFGQYYCQSLYYTNGAKCSWCYSSSLCQDPAEFAASCVTICPVNGSPQACVQAGCISCNASMNFDCVLSNNSTCSQSCHQFSNDPSTCGAATGCFFCYYTSRCLRNGTEVCDPCNSLRSSECSTVLFNKNTSTFVFGCGWGDVCEKCKWCDSSAMCVDESSPAAADDVCATPCGRYDRSPAKCASVPGCTYCSVGARSEQCLLSSAFDAQCDPCSKLTDQYSCNSLTYDFNSSSMVSFCSPGHVCRKCAFCPSKSTCISLNRNGSLDASSLCPGWTSPCSSLTGYCYSGAGSQFNVNCSVCGQTACLSAAEMPQCQQPCSTWDYDAAGCDATLRCKLCLLTSSGPKIGILSSSVCIPLTSPCTACTINPTSYVYSGFTSVSAACAAHPISFGYIIDNPRGGGRVINMPSDTTMAGKCAFCPATSDCLPVLTNGSLQYQCPQWIDVCSSFDGDATTCNSVQYNRTGQVVVDSSRCTGGRCGSCGYCRSTNKCMKMRLMNSSTCPSFTDVCSVWDSMRENCTSLALLVLQGNWQPPPCVNASCTYCGYCPKSSKCYSLEGYSAKCGSDWTGPCGKYDAAECPTNVTANYNARSNTVSLDCGGNVCCPHRCAVCPASGLCNTIHVGDTACSTAVRPAVAPYAPHLPPATGTPQPTTPQPQTPQPTAAVPTDVTYTFVNATGVNQSAFISAITRVAQISPNVSVTIASFTSTTITVRFSNEASAQAASSANVVTQLQTTAGFSNLQAAAVDSPTVHEPAPSPGISPGVIIGVIIGVVCVVAIVGVAVKKGLCAKGARSHKTFAYTPEDFVDSDKRQSAVASTVQMGTLQDASERRQTVEEV